MKAQAFPPPRPEYSENLLGEPCLHRWEGFAEYRLRNYAMCMQPMCGMLSRTSGTMMSKSEMYHLVDELRAIQGELQDG